MKKSILKVSMVLAIGVFAVGCNDNNTQKSSQTTTTLKSDYTRGYTPIFVEAPKVEKASSDKSVFDDNVRFVLGEKVDMLDKQTRKKIGQIYEGVMVKVLDEKDGFSLVSVSGEVGSDKTTLSHKVSDGENLYLYLQTQGVEATKNMEFWIKSTELTKSLQTAWEEIELVYYDSCTSCHSAHNPKEHPMDEWDAYLSAMQLNAKITDEQKDRILRFLQAYAGDGEFK